MPTNCREDICMSKKKRFGISEALTRGLSETIHVVEHNAGLYRNVVLPLSRIELDPDNPRKLAIDLTDVRAGIRSEDPLYQRKQAELEKRIFRSNPCSHIC